MCRLLQVVVGIGMRETRWQAARTMQRKVELGCAEFEIITSLILRIETEGNRG